MISSPIVLGHVHLKVRDLDRAVRFYTETFALTVTERVGNQYAFLTNDDRHHTIALQSRGESAPNPHPYAVGLYHVAFEVPDKRAFAERYHALEHAGVEVVAVDHGISWAMYFNDPDGNGLEIYTDTRQEMQARPDWNGVSYPLSSETLVRIRA